MRRPWLHSLLALVLGALGCQLGQPRTAAAQLPCEGPVEQRLRQALGLGPRDALYATRDYHPGLLPGRTFYRASVPTGFHTKSRRAAIIIQGTDTLVLGEVGDLSRPWADLSSRHQGPPNQLALLFAELLYQTGFLERADKVLHSAADLPELVRRSLDPRADISQIKPPAVEVTTGRTEVVLFVLTPDGITRVRARTDAQGVANVAADVVAQTR